MVVRVQSCIQNPPSLTSTMEPVTKIVKGFQLLITFAKNYILDVCLGSGYFSGVNVKKTIKFFAVVISKGTGKERQ